MRRPRVNQRFAACAAERVVRGRSILALVILVVARGVPAAVRALRVASSQMAAARDDRPYDAQLLGDLHTSRSHDHVAYVVADNLGGALGLLVSIPVVAFARGSLGVDTQTPRSQ